MLGNSGVHWKVPSYCNPLKLIVLEAYYRIIFFPLNSSLGYWSPYTDQI